MQFIMDLLNCDAWKSKSAEAVRKGEFLKVINTFISRVPDAGNGIEWCQQFDAFLADVPDEELEEELVCSGVAALLLFVQTHWTGPYLNAEAVDVIGRLKNRESEEAIRKKLIIGDGDAVFIQHPHLLLFALTIFQYGRCQKGLNSMTTHFWAMRGYFIQQLVLEEISPVLYRNILSCVEKFSDEFGASVFCRLEKARIYSYYKSLESAQKEMDAAQDEMKFSYVLTGVLGKRTKFQQHDVAQLLCFTQSSVSNQPQIITGSADVPFQDDLRLEHMQPTDPSVLANESELTSAQYAFLLASVVIRRMSLPNHETHNEENRSIIERLFRGKGPWAPTISAHLLQLELETETARRLIEAEKKIDWTLREIEKSVCNLDRLDCFFVSYLPSIVELKMKLAEFYYHCGDYKTALAFYEKLHCWKFVINCLMKLSESHRAELIIRKELEKQPDNVAMWSYLGDVTDDEQFYAKAVELSSGKSALAERHWGLHFYQKRNFSDCIDHFQKSLQLNQFQPDIWRKLGWAAIETKNYDLGAKSYKQYCMQENDDRDAWSNLAFCYSEMGEVEKGITILKEALKVDMNFFKTWDSLAVMHCRVKQYDEAIRAYQQVLKRNPGHIDPWVLKTLFIAYMEDKIPGKRGALISIFQETIRSKTSIDPFIGIMYADLVKATEQEQSILTELHTKASSMNSWERQEDIQLFLLDIMERMLQFAKENPKGKILFNLLTKPSIAAVLAYDPDNTRYRAFQEKIQKELP